MLGHRGLDDALLGEEVGVEDLGFFEVHGHGENDDGDATDDGGDAEDEAHAIGLGADEEDDTGDAAEGEEYPFGIVAEFGLLFEAFDDRGIFDRVDLADAAFGFVAEFEVGPDGEGRNDDKDEAEGLGFFVFEEEADDEDDDAEEDAVDEDGFDEEEQVFGITEGLGEISERFHCVMRLD